MTLMTPMTTTMMTHNGQFMIMGSLAFMPKLANKTCVDEKVVVFKIEYCHLIFSFLSYLTYLMCKITVLAIKLFSKNYYHRK